MVPLGYAGGVVLTMFQTGGCLNPMYALAVRVGVSWIYIGNPTTSGGGAVVVEPTGDVSHNIWDVDMFVFFASFFMAQVGLYVSRASTVALTVSGKNKVGSAADAEYTDDAADANGY
jgi:hypothetical protein